MYKRQATTKELLEISEKAEEEEEEDADALRDFAGVLAACDLAVLIVLLSNSIRLGQKPIKLTRYVVLCSQTGFPLRSKISSALLQPKERKESTVLI